MTHSWYNLYKQANSLPFDLTIDEVDPRTFEFAKSKYSGMGNIDYHMYPETAEKEKQKKPKFLGCGLNGVVTDIGNNRVRKYTIDPTEATLAESLIENTKYPVVKVFSVEQLQVSLWAIDMEKLTPVNKIAPQSNMFISDIAMYIKENNSEPSFNKFLLYLSSKGFININDEQFHKKLKPQYKNVFKKMERFFLLKEIRLIDDLKIENLGENSKGEWLLFDLQPIGSYNSLD